MGRWPAVIAELHPKQFTAEQLEQEIKAMYKEFHPWRSILRRLPLSKASAASWLMNLSQRNMLDPRASRTNFDGI